jgi:integrase
MKAIINSSLLLKIKPAEKEYDIWDAKLTGFILRVNPNGNLVYRCEYARGKRITIGNAKILTPMQARERAKEILADAVKGVDPQAKKKDHTIPTFKSFLENEYILWHQAHTKQGNQDIDRIKRHFFEPFGDKKLFEIDTRSVEKWCTKRLNEGIKPATINRDITTLKSLLSKALKWELIKVHPLVNLKPVKVDSLSKIRYLSKEEESRLRKTLDIREENLRQTRMSHNRWRNDRGYPPLPNFPQNFFVDHVKPMVLLSMNTGIRRGELLALEWKDADFPTAILSIRGDTTKSSMTRYIPLNTEALQALKQWRQQSSGEGLIFPSKNDSRFSNLRRAWHSILKQAEIENFRWHDMRHHFASRLVMASVDLNTVRELLGHSDIKMTLRYAHLAPEHKAEAVARLVKEENII